MSGLDLRTQLAFLDFLSPTPEMDGSWLLCAYETQLLTCKQTVSGLNLALMGPVTPAIKAEAVVKHLLTQLPLLCLCARSARCTRYLGLPAARLSTCSVH